MDWKPIDTFPGDTRFEERTENGEVTRFYDTVLVRGPSWQGVDQEDAWPPQSKTGSWSGPEIEGEAYTWSSIDFFVIPAGEVGFDTFVKPTHWRPR